MSDTTTIQIAPSDLVEYLDALAPTRRERVTRKLAAAALGAIPWVGGLLTARLAFTDETGQLKVNAIQHAWLVSHQEKLVALTGDLAGISTRLEELGDDVLERVESESYLALVRKAFKIYDKADTETKRQYVCKFIANAAAIKLTEDDIIRLFLGWLDSYHEAHFMIIREVFQRPNVTRLQIWQQIHGPRLRDDSPEAGLFRFLIRELSTGGIIHQHRVTRSDGTYQKKPPAKRPPGMPAPREMVSAFDDQARYELTPLGKQFVHYVFAEIVPRMEEASARRE